MNKNIQNERTKLLATWYNNASIAVLVTGFIAPFWTIVYGTSQSYAEDVSRTIGFFACCAAGAILRFLAQRALGSLE